MGGLEKHFEGENSWIKYSNNFGDNWTGSEFQMELLTLIRNQMDLAKVIYYHFTDFSIKWINSKISELDNLTPLECLENEELTKRLKVCLMRFPF